MALIPFISIAFSFSWSSQQLGPKKLESSDEKNVNKILMLGVYLAATLFLIFNIICIYIYISHIGQNPFVDNLLIQYVKGN